MKVTVSIKCKTTKAQDQILQTLRNTYMDVCNAIVPSVVSHRCWNRVALHHLVYHQIRKQFPLGSQMVCNALFAVCKAYKNKALTKDEEIPTIQFRKHRSIHFDKRTYKMKGTTLSLYTLEGRIQVEMKIGSFQQNYLSQGVFKEAELVCRKGIWYFNLVLDIPDAPLSPNQKILGVDLGENVIAAISSGDIMDGGKIRYERDQFLAKRRRLQSNGSQSAKQLLKKISGKEARRMKQMNHQVSKKIVQEAMRQQAGVIVLEDLKNIRSRIKARKRVRTRLHRWSYFQLQTQVEYKALQKGLRVIYVNPAYSSQTCSHCGQLGVRLGNTFTCSCGNQQHSDLNASRNLCRFAMSLDTATCAVNRTQVAALV